MGQAKLRGTPEQRRHAAIERQLSLRPKYVKCNHCQAELTELQPMGISDIKGIEAAFAAHCPHCGSVWHLSVGSAIHPDAMR